MGSLQGKIAIIASAGIAAEELRTHFPPAGTGNVGADSRTMPAGIVASP